MFLPVITKNLNREILTKSLITFKIWDGVKDGKFYYYAGWLKNSIFREGIHEKPIYRGELSRKRWAWTVCRFKGGLMKKRVAVF